MTMIPREPFDRALSEHIDVLGTIGFAQKAGITTRQLNRIRSRDQPNPSHRAAEWSRQQWPCKGELRDDVIVLDHEHEGVRGRWSCRKAPREGLAPGAKLLNGEGHGGLGQWWWCEPVVSGGAF